jgi:phosphatidylserine decarboxylase
MKYYFLIFLIIFLFVLLLFRQEKYKQGNCFYNQDDELICEKIESVEGLNFLYNNSLGVIFRKVIRLKFISELMGIYNNSSVSRFKIKSFIKKYNIDVSEFLNPENSFKSFNDFFIRKLKPGYRAFEQDLGKLCSPADSKLFVVPNISEEIDFFVKNKKFNLKTFLKDEKLAEKYKNGTMLIFRLSPPDYHRYHFPFKCVAKSTKIVNGIYESVNPIVYKSGVQPLYENERQLVVLDNENFGKTLLISVGAMFVGKIIHTYTPNQEYNAGDEIGYFEFGGSTLVLLFEKDKVTIQERYLNNSIQGYETEVVAGQVINV